jgi:hypothetical protein
MISSKVKTLVIVFALLALTSIITVGCKQRSRSSGLMNTDSLPGKSFVKGVHKKNNARRNSNIVYLGSEGSSHSDGFGPGDVSFEFQALR